MYAEYFGLSETPF